MITITTTDINMVYGGGGRSEAFTAAGLRGVS